MTDAKNARFTSMFPADDIRHQAPQGLVRHHNGVGVTMAVVHVTSVEFTAN